MKEPIILIADDEPFITELTIEYLNNSEGNYKCIVAENGAEALKKVQKHKPDLLITDWDMPVMNGIELVKAIRTQKETEDLPIIVNSGVNIASADLSIALAAGANDFLRKPIDEIELIARVQSMLQLSASIQEIKRQQQEMNQQLAFQKTLINTISYPVFYYSTNGIVQGYNQLFNTLFKEQVSMPNSSVFSFFVMDGVDIHIQNDKKLIQDNEAIYYEHEVAFPDGARHNVIFTKAPYHDHTGKLEGIICIMVDITELKQAHNQLLESKTKDLTSKTMKLLQSSELNARIIEDLRKLNQYTNKKGEALINGLINTYQLNSNDKSWEEFDLRFKEVHSGFYEKLQQRFPKLSPNEKKLCAFLKLNMTTKEIAAITFQNPQSIDMARHRLRKKIELPKDINLTTFILEL